MRSTGTVHIIVSYLIPSRTKYSARPHRRQDQKPDCLASNAIRQIPYELPDFTVRHRGKVLLLMYQRFLREKVLDIVPPCSRILAAAVAIRLCIRQDALDAVAEIVGKDGFLVPDRLDDPHHMPCVYSVHRQTADNR